MFRLEQRDGYPPVAVESVWAKAIGDDLYEVENIPFYAKGVALGDVVRAAADESGALVFSSIVRPSGHSTLRVVFLDKSQVERIERSLESMGCGWEGGLEPSLISVDVPPSVDMDSLFAFLSNASRQDVLDFETGVIADAR